MNWNAVLDPTRERIMNQLTSRFFGIVIRMFSEPGTSHHVPHFHAYYQDEVAVVAIDPVDILAGGLPHAGRKETPIEPLK